MQVRILSYVFGSETRYTVEYKEFIFWKDVLDHRFSNSIFCKERWEEYPITHECDAKELLQCFEDYISCFNQQAHNFKVIAQKSL